jgi:hypothetical protein
VPRGVRYVSEPEEWQRDAPDAGFACLGFSLTSPQYYQYAYASNRAGFVVTAHGDADGDGRLSRFVLRGRVEGNRVELGEVESEDEDE